MRNTHWRGQIERERKRFMQKWSPNGLFDELKRMPQSSFVMRCLGILLVAVVSGLSAYAQQYAPYTNTRSFANTNASTAVTGTNFTVPDEIYAELTNQLST